MLKKRSQTVKNGIAKLRVNPGIAEVANERVIKYSADIK